MSKAPTVPVNPDRLSWARREAGLDVGEAARRVSVKPDRLLSWEQGLAQPTVNQLRNLAGTYRRTPAFFLVAEPPPSSASRPPDYRGRADEGVNERLARELTRASQRREAFLKLQADTGRASLPNIPNVLQHPAEASVTLRDRLGISLEQQTRFPDTAKALTAWISVVEDRCGVLVFQMSGVEPKECRGFSIYEPSLSVIVLNGADDTGARIFTLFHELAHLLTRSGGICEVWREAGTEWQCNRFAGAFLLPEQDLLEELGEDNPVSALRRLASKYKVTQSAVAVRLRDIGLISQVTLDEQLAEAARVWAERRRADRESERKSGPPRHVLQLRNLGAQYVSTVLDAMHSEVITAVDAAYYLESKLGTVDRMEEELVKRAAS